MSLNKKETQSTLDAFKKYVIQQSRTNLTKGNKNVSKKLYDSIDGVAKVMPNSFALDFTMEEYGLYQDKGVSGVKVKYNTPYSYTTKMPPAKVFDKWVIKKGLAPRTASGKFMNREGLKWAIAKSIFNKGIKPSLFFTKPFEQAFKELPDQVAEAYGLDVENFMDFSLKDIK